MQIDLKKITIANCGTHHLYKGKPLYDKRFKAVLKFSSLKIAAVSDNTGAYHINTSGKPIYKKVFDKTYGFYCEYAAVATGPKYFHINPDGVRFYNKDYEWVGNYQEELCVVKEKSKFFHINSKGLPIYTKRYEYVGDFKDGIAVVYDLGRASHIDITGKLIHNKWFKYLDVYHKGYARAEDEDGWFHIDKKGNELYSARYKNAEPFYNDLARVERFNGEIVQISPSNQVITLLKEANDNQLESELSDNMVGFWKTFIIYTAVILNIFDNLPSSLDKLEAKTKIPQNNLMRLLRALWEIGLVYKENNLWKLSEKGCLLSKRNNCFLPDASIMWATVAQQKWFELPKLLKQKNITSHPSFKDKEANKQNIQCYQRALEGYVIREIKTFVPKLNFNNKKIMAFGRSSLALVNYLYSLGNKVTATVIIDSDQPEAYAPLKNIKITESALISKDQFNLGIMFRFLHYFDDKTASFYLSKVKELGIKELFIFETIISEEQPTGGLLDINMIVETGGKLRTKKELKDLFNKHNYNINFEEKVTPYLTFIKVTL